MQSLYLLLILMLLTALGILVIPFLQKRTAFFKSYFLVSTLLILFSVTIYQLSGDKKAVKQWLTGGKQQYQLQEKIIEMGGIDGIINRIQKKLENNPNDVRGWLILGKIYLSQKNIDAALSAFTKAHELAPNDPDVSKYYEAIKKEKS